MDHPTNLQIAAEFDCNRHTVAGWRNRYLSNGLAGLQDAPRSGRPRRFSPSERLDLINLASSTTEQQGCPATRWSLDDLAATLINRTAHDLAMSRSTIWLTSSLLLEQELRFIQKINGLLDRGMLIDSGYRHIDVHRIIMEHDLDYSSQLDRSPSFICRMMAYGRERAKQFLDKKKWTL